MYFRSIAEVQLHIISFPDSIAKIQQPKFCFKLKPDTNAYKIICITGADIFCMSKTNIGKAIEIRIKPNEITIFCSKYRIPVGINTFFIKTPQQTVAANLEQFIQKILLALVPTNVYRCFECAILANGKIMGSRSYQFQPVRF